MHHHRRIAILCIVVLLLLTSSGCNQLRNARPITDVDQPDGQRVGVVLGYAPDYLLSAREDVTLMRYNTMADMVVALCFRRVDAIAVEEMYVSQILHSVQGVRCIEQSLVEDGITALINIEREELLRQFNAFVADFQTTDAYADLDRRAKDRDGYVPCDVPIAEHAEQVLRACVVDTAYPFSYVDLSTGEYLGIDVEILRWFAYTYGYRLELDGGTWGTMDLGVCHGRYDIGVGGVSDLYRGDYEMTDLCFVSAIYMDMDVLFIEVEDSRKLKIVNNITE